MIAVLARLPLARIVRVPRVWINLGAWSAVATAFAVTARAGGWLHGADHVLVGVYGALVLPLIAYGLAGAALGARSLADSTAPVIAFGASPELAALAELLVAAGVCAFVGAVLAAVVALVAHGIADPPVARDVVTSAHVGALGGAAYASWFVLGAAFGRRGAGRTVFLVVDWALGASESGVSLLTPRGHLRNLLGGLPPSNLSQRSSSAALAVITIGCALLAIYASRRRA